MTLVRQAILLIMFQNMLAIIMLCVVKFQTV